MLKQSISVLTTCVCAFSVDVATYHNDNGRTGQNPYETTLTTANVVSSTFGKLFTIPVDGKVDAEPLYLSAVTFGGVVHNALYVATENDSVYAFDADTGAQLWKAAMLKTGETPSDNRNCSQVSPQIGVTSTPVISRTTGANGMIYAVAMSKDSSGNYHQRIHALDLTTGAEQFSGPVDIAAMYPGTGDNTNGTDVVFDPKQYEDRAALLYLNGVVYTSFSSHCDIRPYTGWVIGYSATTLAQTSVLDFTPNGSEGSVWMAGDGPQADTNGNIYFLAANGTFDTTLNTNSFPINGDYGNAFLKLSTAGNTLAVTDYFEMFNGVTESNNDQDLGSGGSLLLPDMADSNGVTRHLAVGAGKDQHIYLVDRDNLGKFNSSSNAIYQDVPSALTGGVWSMPAYFNGHLYYGGVGGPLQSYTFASAKLMTPAAFSTAHTFAFPGTTPSVSSNGSAEGIVWAVENSSPAVLHAYDATDLIELYNSNQAANSRDQFGAGNKFITPMIVNGKVYVGTPNSVAVFGILPAQPPAITSSLKASGRVNRSFSYQITASQNPTSFSAAGLPSGLAVNTSTGKISGTPKATGTTTVTIGAANPFGTGNANLVITVKH